MSTPSRPPLPTIATRLRRAAALRRTLSLPQALVNGGRTARPARWAAATTGATAPPPRSTALPFARSAKRQGAKAATSAVWCGNEAAAPDRAKPEPNARQEGSCAPAGSTRRSAGLPRPSPPRRRTARAPGRGAPTFTRTLASPAARPWVAAAAPPGDRRTAPDRANAATGAGRRRSGIPGSPASRWWRRSRAAGASAHELVRQHRERQAQRPFARAGATTRLARPCRSLGGPGPPGASGQAASSNPASRGPRRLRRAATGAGAGREGGAARRACSEPGGRGRRRSGPETPPPSTPRRGSCRGAPPGPAPQPRARPA